MNEECIEALQIFNRISHPSAHKSSGNYSREGLSLYSNLLIKRKQEHLRYNLLEYYCGILLRIVTISKKSQSL